ncbi:MAG: sulfotransferase family 2 domain-containing protein [Pseudomonadota bacterium]
MTRPRYFAIFGAMRTGSNLFERTLNDYDRLIGLGELFNPAFIGGPDTTEAFGWTIEDRNRDPLGFLEAVIAAHPGETPGFRIFDGHDGRVIDHAAADPDCARFVLARDPLDSHLSLKIARETNQWMVRKAENKKLVKVAFDAEEFEAYRAGLAAHYARVRGLMRAAGRPWFAVDYDDLGDLATLNGAAAYAGSAEAKEQVAPKIERQNPPAAADKVMNPEDLPTGPVAAAPVVEVAPKFLALKSFLVARGLEVISAPIPGVADGALRDFLSAAQAAAGEAGQDIVEGVKGKQIERRRKRGAFVFSVIRHPVDRIRAVFAEMVVGGAAPEGLEGLGDLLRERYGAPDFDAFLSFVEDNIAGRTAAPYHPAWAPQADLLAAYAAETPVDFVARAETIADDAAWIAKRLGLQAGALAGVLEAGLAPPSGPDLSPAQIARIEAIYARDYARLGYKPAKV